MALNEIYPFAIGDGANVESAALWAGDNTRAIGFQTGIASSMRANTALRQAAFTSAMIAQFTADYQPGDVHDDGNVPVYEAEFVAALHGAVQTIIPAGLLFEGTDIGTQNGAIVTSTTPPLTAFPVGGFIGVHKMGVANSGPMTMHVLNVTAPIIWPDGTALGSGVWPANAEALFFYDGTHFQLLTFPGPGIFSQLGAGEGITVGGGLINLGFQTLQEEDDLALSDLFAFYQTVDEGGLPQGHHRKTTWGNILAKILALIPPCPDAPPPALPGNGGPGPDVGQFVTQPVAGASPAATPGTGNYPPGYSGYSVGMSASGAQIQAGSVPVVATPGYTGGYQSPLHSPNPPSFLAQGGVGPDWEWPINLTGTWKCAGWNFVPGYANAWGYTFYIYWVRIL